MGLMVRPTESPDWWAPLSPERAELEAAVGRPHPPAQGREQEGPVSPVGRSPGLPASGRPSVQGWTCGETSALACLPLSCPEAPGEQWWWRESAQAQSFFSSVGQGRR